MPIKAAPKSGRNEICGWENGALKVRLRAAPDKGEANVALITFLAKTFGIAKARITLARGETARHKMLKIEGISQEDLERLIDELLY